MEPSAPALRAAFEIETSSTGRDLALLALSAAGNVLLCFLVWEGVERMNPPVLRETIHLLRGVSTSLLTAALVGVLSWRQHRRRAALLRALSTRHEGEARRAQALLALVNDATPASLIVLDANLNIVQANSTAERVHGTGLVGRACREAFGGCPTDCGACPASVSLESGRPSAVERPHTDPRTGEVLAVESRPFALPDGTRLVLLVERVVTEQRKLQARLVHQEKMAAFGLLAAGVAHDMGNPLSSVEAQLQLVDEPSLSGENAQVIRTVRGEVARLRRILRELIDFARKRRDEATLVSVQGVVEDALRLLRHDRRMRDVTVTVAADPETPPVRFVEDHLMQVVLNLLLNAVDAMPHGGSLRIEVCPAAGDVALRIHDSGQGMDRAVLARCFEPLFTTKDPGKGTGLGLSISRDILTEAGGAIELHSARGAGTTAVVTLPPAALELLPALPRREVA